MVVGLEALAWLENDILFDAIEREPHTSFVADEFHPGCIRHGMKALVGQAQPGRAAGDSIRVHDYPFCIRRWNDYIERTPALQTVIGNCWHA
jgi:hypothetical protein